MPLYEYACLNEACPMYLVRRERFSWRIEDTDPPCDHCGSATTRLVSVSHPVFTGEISGKYLRDPHTPEARMGGHWVWRRRSSRSGKPEPVFIRTWQEQACFCKEEGLYNPRDLPPEKGEV